uniref:Nidogen n=1 Tax=Bursaphelenchus xylophilus TaxID=6326 RepID=A0A1I7SEF3_BURXY
MVTKIIWIFLTALIAVNADLIPYGEGYGDQFIPFSDEPVATVLRYPFVLFRERYQEFYISPHGAVSFETPLSGLEELDNKNVIAPFYAEAKSGHIYFRIDYANSALDRNITRKLKMAFDIKDFHATELVLVTWEDVEGVGVKGMNTFQLGLATDGVTSYAIFTYSKLDYAFSGTKFVQIGFWGRGEDPVFGFNSGSESARDLDKMAYAGEKGLYVYYTVGRPELGQKPMEDEYDYKEMEKEYDELSDEDEEVEQPKGYQPGNPNPAPANVGGSAGLTCSQTPSSEDEKCHPSARCEANGPGFCCQCADGYLGNGKKCYAKSTAVRVNGFLEGAVNGIPVERTEFYVYITPEAGQQHTTIPKISSTVGVSLQFLDEIANVNDWLFAKVESHNAKNGIQLTGGRFNQSSTISIGDKSHLVIRQQFRPKPNSDDLEVEVSISGTIPDLPYGSTIEFSEFDAKFTKSEPGRLRSYADRHVAVTSDGVESQYRITVDQQIRYDDCPYAQSGEAVYMVHTDRISGVYEPKDETLRFGSQSVVYNEEDSANANSRRRNPCSGTHVCTEQNMKCVPEESTYRCVCEDGYQIERDSTVQAQFRCIDRNECAQPGICDRNAVCENSVGSYTCTCREGFVGDGRSCRPEGDPGPAAPAGSTACTDHKQCHQWGECVFSQSGEPGYCKCRGWYVGDGVSHCGPPDPNAHQEGRCGVHVCHEHAECRQNEGGQDLCVCKSGYHGNGVSCVPLPHQPVRVPDPRGSATAGTVCRTDQECSENAQCAYSAHLGYYRCECKPPYYGDGTDCILDESRPAPETCETRLGCHRHALCVATGQREPAARCQCLQGYEGNGFDCVEEKEYKRLHGEGEAVHYGGPQQPHEPQVVPKHACKDQSECHRFGRCMLTSDDDPIFYCACADGYRGDGFQSCVQVDNECDPTNAFACNSNAQCRLVHNNEAHAYLCECNKGYVKHGEHCVPEHTPIIDTPVDVEPVPAAPSPGQCEACSPQAYCHRHPDGVNYNCVCHAGYVGDGKRCSKARSCVEDRGLCNANAQCLPDSRNQYVCSCNYGFHGNGYVCNPTPEDQPGSLLIARGMSIIQRPTREDVVGRQLVVVPHQVVVDIGYDCVSQRIYWSDIGGATIKSAWVNGTDIQTVFKSDLKSPEGIAIDWTARNIYYADSMKDEIGVITIDGKYRKTLLTEGLVNPRALAIDLERRHLFYSDWYRQRPHIGRLNLDGTGHKADFIRDDIGLPNGLVVLQRRRELCWVDAGKQVLACTNLEGQQRRVVFAPLEYPFGLTHDNEETFYWTDWKDHQIHSVSVYGTNHKSFVPSAAGKGKLYGIHSLDQHCQGSK